MKRSEFLKEMQKGFLQTTKELFMPFVEDDILKVSRVVEDYSGYTWVEIPVSIEDARTGVTNFYQDGKLYYLYKQQDDVSIVDAACPLCKYHLHYMSYNETFHCMNCDKTYTLEDALTGNHVPISERNGKMCMGIREKG